MIPEISCPCGDTRGKTPLECTVSLRIGHKQDNQYQRHPVVPQKLVRKALDDKKGQPVNCAAEEERHPSYSPHCSHYPYHMAHNPLRGFDRGPLRILPQSNNLSVNARSDHTPHTSGYSILNTATSLTPGMY